MTNRVRGDERRGEDGDEGHGNNVRVVQIENAYHEKLRERMGQQPGFTPLTPEEAAWVSRLLGPEDEKRPPGPVIYNDDGSIYKRPG